ncbi:MAG: LacI family DNA-binding transcriptional regulator [Thermogemmatispora sp.]|uniref:LacI family DNA-binding transcriptional regulator n=1 Tax=Thermogemmatispora sp. TaxID=1968838 RepID=UPI00262A2665|nr:LacI family DNA-binding transcriptional regulator [Thermogemmatispora sp.]MBX5459219.1 LacI family DNA-binding transcriptional regulator [Thermogemmatispora sp.]
MNTKSRQSMNRRRSTIAEIAARAGVSIPTVSRVLNNRPDVAPATRERVERVIREAGYVRSRVANALRRGSSGIIDLVVPDLDSPYYFEIIRGVEEVLERTELRMALSTTHDESRRERQWLRQVIEGATDGAILVLAQGQSDRLDELRRHRIPFVVVDHRGELGPDVPSVGATNWAGGRAATEYLLSLGHRRIAIIAGWPNLRCSQDRIAGYRAALEEAGLPIEPELIRPGEFRQQTGYDQTCALLALPQPPTAIFAGSDLQAMGVYAALRAHGLRVPDDVSVVGFDDVPIATMVSPTLTTIRQPLAEMGRMATTMLLRLIAGEPLDSMRIELATSLVVRESCAPPPSPDR